MVNNLHKDKQGRLPIKSVRIETVDAATVDYFEKKLSPTVTAERGPYKVPVLFAAGERWKLIRKNKFRDEHGTLILPIISVRRGDIDRTPGFGGMAQETKYITVSKVIHSKTNTLQGLVDARKKRGLFWEKKKEPIIEYTTIPFPDFCTINYEITFWTQYNTQMNELLEKVFYKYEWMDSFVMPVEYDGKKPRGDSYYFVGFREGAITKESNDDNFTDQERLLRYSYKIKVPAYLILDPDDEALSYGREEDGANRPFKSQSVNKIKLKETVLTSEEFEKLYG